MPEKQTEIENMEGFVTVLALMSLRWFVFMSGSIKSGAVFSCVCLLTTQWDLRVGILKSGLRLIFTFLSVRLPLHPFCAPSSTIYHLESGAFFLSGSTLQTADVEGFIPSQQDQTLGAPRPSAGVTADSTQSLVTSPPGDHEMDTSSPTKPVSISSPPHESC